MDGEALAADLEECASTSMMSAGSRTSTEAQST